MAQDVSARVTFGSDFNGVLKLQEGEVAIGVQAHQARPYDLLQAALAACLHATFLDIITKKRLTIERCEYEISGVKQDEIPSVLRQVHVRVRMNRHEKEDQLIKAMELASKYCSVFNTLSQVANMTLDVVFE
jgi:putative redox protein